MAKHPGKLLFDNQHIQHFVLFLHTVSLSARSSGSTPAIHHTSVVWIQCRPYAKGHLLFVAIAKNRGKAGP